MWSQLVMQDQQYGASVSCDVPVYIQACAGDIPALTPAEAGIRLSDPGGMQG